MFSLSKCIRSFRYAFNGISIFFRTENNAKVHLLASIVVILLALYFDLSVDKWLWLITAIGIVWITETINTSIEKLVDLISPEQNPKAGVIKDLAAGAVLFASFLSLIIGVLIFKNHFLQLFSYLKNIVSS